MGEAAAKALAINPNLVFAQALHAAGSVESYSYLKELEAFEHASREEPGNADLLDLLSYDLLQAGYVQEGLNVADQYVELDPLSSGAHSRRADALWAMGRREEAIRTYDMAGHLGNREAAEISAYMKLFWLGDDSGITRLESSKDPGTVALWAGIRELIAAARDPSLGAAYIERRIPEILASMPEGDRFEYEQWLSSLYLDFGFLDRYYEQILAYDLTASNWTDADILIYVGTVSRESGFTAHPKYLEVAELTGLIDVWEKRGPPDFCSRPDGRWDCR
jgi:tetratricopeptide (TPR) repeat protein